MNNIKNVNADTKFNGKFRHEYKYICSDMQLAILKSRINGLIALDSHVGSSGMYNIRSVYFDDYYNSCLAENISGTDPREKFRIRIYNCSSDKISLELKRKVGGKTQKHSCPLSLEQFRLLIKGVPLPVNSDDPPILQKMCLQMRQRMLKPVVIVDYDRIPYVLKEGNVRVTLDLNIASSFDYDGFFSPDMSRRPIMPVGRQVLEVKWDEFLPAVIYHSLQLESLQRTAFSKYHLCRQFSMNGGIVL